MRTRTLAKLLLICSFVVPAAAQDDVQGVLDAGAEFTGRTVIMGTWMWDIETNRQKRSPHVDLWWQQVNETDQFLVPQGNARLSILGETDYDSLTAADLRQLRFRRVRVSNAYLLPGAVLALMTNEGNLAKIRIIGFRALHDISFPDVHDAYPGWTRFLHSQPNRPEYHLEVEWTLY